MKENVSGCFFSEHSVVLFAIYRNNESIWFVAAVSFGE